MAERNNVPVLVGDIATVQKGFQPPMGRVGHNNDSNVVEGIVLLQKNEQSLPALRALKEKVFHLNHGNLLPPGMQIKPYYDRTKLINVTTDTVKHIILTGLALVTLVLVVTIGDFRTTLLAVLTIPFAVLFALTLMVMTGTFCQFDFDWRHRFWDPGGCVDRGAGERVSKTFPPD